MQTSERQLVATLRRFEATADPGDLERGEGLALALGLKYGSDTIRVSRLLLKRRFRVQAFAVARGFVELSISLFWAARADNGWNRFLGHFARNDIERAERCVKAFGRPRAEYLILSDMDALTLAAVRPCMPDMAGLLQQIHAADEADGLPSAAGSAAQSYAGLFCFLHPAAHGSPTAIDDANRSEYEWHLDVFLSQAAIFSIRAALIYRESNEDALWAPIVEQMERRCLAEGFPGL